MNTGPIPGRLSDEQLLDYMSEHFDVDPARGTIHLRKPGRNRRVGELAGHVGHHGYRLITIRGRRYLRHRLIFLFSHGWCPEMLDHVDRDRLNDQISNLRPADRSQNQWNSGLYRNNSSGVMGVELRDGRWIARLAHRGERHCKSFATKAEAVEQRIRWERAYHGQYAPQASA